jgi:hypothetical protein
MTHRLVMAEVAAGTVALPSADLAGNAADLNASPSRPARAAVSDSFTFAVRATATEAIGDRP